MIAHIAANGPALEWLEFTQPQFERHGLTVQVHTSVAHWSQLKLELILSGIGLVCDADLWLTAPLPNFVHNELAACLNPSIPPNPRYNGGLWWSPKAIPTVSKFASMVPPYWEEPILAPYVKHTLPSELNHLWRYGPPPKSIGIHVYGRDKLSRFKLLAGKDSSR